ncbi:MAG TPA: hypothetical protein DCY35_05935 [Prolixibacteraceae bacterium]|jgi:hypothetical protein|nr:hypothetical protein [Prolixibacteraceae bacterium]
MPSEIVNLENRRTLFALVNMIIPPSKDRKMPGAADIGFVDYVYSEKALLWIQEGLSEITELSHIQYEREFSILSGPEQMRIIDGLRRRKFRFFSNLLAQVVSFYYQNDRVLALIGLESRPPFPQGYQLEEGDLTLLEPVYNRGKIYRD